MGRRKPAAALPASGPNDGAAKGTGADKSHDKAFRRRGGKKKARYEAQPDPKGFYPITVKMDMTDIGALDYLVSRLPSTRMSKTRSRAVRDAIHQVALASGYGPSL
jgi:hypothetical protein